MNGKNGNFDRHIKAFEAEREMSLEKRQEILNDLLSVVINRCVDGSECEEYCAKRLFRAKVEGRSEGWVDLVTFKVDKPQPSGPDALIAGITKSDWDPEPQGKRRINGKTNYLFSQHYLIFETAEEQRQTRSTHCRMVPTGTSPDWGSGRLHRHELSSGHPDRAQKLATVSYDEVVFLQNLLDPNANHLIDPTKRRK